MEKQINDKKGLEVILLIASAILFVLIWINLSSSWIISFDNFVNSQMQGIENNSFTFIAEKLSYIFDPINCAVFLIILSLILWLKKFRRTSIFLACSSIIGAGLIYILKNFIMKIRPENSIIFETGFAFPSGHATMSLILFGCLIYYSIKYLKSKVLKWMVVSLLLIFTMLIGFSRIYLRVHWFSDVISGFLLGLFVISLAMILPRIIIKFFKGKSLAF